MSAVVTGVVTLRSGVTLLGRVSGQNGSLITQASLSAVAYTVRDLTAALTVATLVPLAVASVVYDGLQQQDPRWTQDSQQAPGADGLWGYNFAATVPAADFVSVDVAAAAPFPVTAHRYDVGVRLTPVSGQPFYLVFQFATIPTYA